MHLLLFLPCLCRVSVLFPFQLRNRHKKWSDLQIKEIYTVTNIRMVDTQNGKYIICTLLNNGAVWVPEHLRNRILTSDKHYNQPLYIRHLWLKPYKSNPKNKYHAYDIVVNYSKSINIKQFSNIFKLQKL